MLADGRGRTKMKILTTRFGVLTVEESDVLHFPAGMLGLEHCRKWVLLADAQNEALGWLQCTTRPEIALAVVSPRRFVPDYQVRVARSELAGLELADPKSAQVLAVLARNEQSITLNLRAPLVINLQTRVGRQVVTSSDQPIQHELTSQRSAWKKSA